MKGTLFIATASMFTLVKTILAPKYRSLRAITIGILGGVPLASLIGLSFYEKYGSINLSLLITAFAALTAETIIYHSIQFVEGNLPTILNKLFNIKPKDKDK